MRIRPLCHLSSGLCDTIVMNLLKNDKQAVYWRRMRNTTKFYVVGFLRNLYFYLPIFTLFLLDRDISLEVVIFSQTFYSLLQFFAEVPTGLFADRYGQKTSIVAGYLIEALGIAAVILSPTVIGLYVCYALGGLAMAFLSGSEEALLYESARHEKVNYQRAYGRFLSMQTWGMVVGTGLSGVAVHVFGGGAYMGLMAATAIALVVCAVISLFQRPYRGTIAAEDQGSGMFRMLKKSVTLIRSNSTVFNLMIGATLTLSGEYFLLGMYQPVFVAAGVPHWVLGVSFAVGLAGSAFLVARAHILERYLTLDAIILFVALALAVGYAAMGLSQHPVVVVIAFLALRSIMEIEAPIVSDYINEHVPSDIRSTTLSGVSLANRLAAVIQRVALTGAIALGGARVSLLMQAAYLVVGGLVAYWLFRRCGCVHRIRPRTAR